MLPSDAKVCEDMQIVLSSPYGVVVTL
jgi:hypothetical protein